MLNSAGAELRRSKYRLLGLVGQGQFGQVFCALHRSTGQLVALKNLEHDRFPTHKFLRELRFLLSLQHPNIVTCRSLEHTSTGRYLVMDYCEGGTLRGLMTEESRLSRPYAIRLVKDLLAGLEHAHSRGIVHCDIKPENILVQLDSAGWLARISDFGIARLSQEIKVQEGATGSPAYMAPERFYGKYSARSDLYSVGILLFELITGARPFSGSPAELMSAHLNRPLQLPDSLPLVWQPVIAQALQKLPGRRFCSAAEMLEAVQLAQAADLPQAQDAALTAPLFSTVLKPPRCRFKPVCHPLEQAVIQLAPAPLSNESYAGSGTADSAADSTALWQASRPATPQIAAEVTTQTAKITKIDCWIKSASECLPQLYPAGVVSAPIEQLWVRPQGCFVATRRSLLLMGLERRLAHPFDVNKPQSVQKIIQTWDQDHSITIDPQGNWAALLSHHAQPIQSPQLRFQPLPGARPMQIASEPIPAPSGSLVAMLALDSRHLALFWPRQGAEPRLASGTRMSLVNRRGNRLGELALPLCLRQICLTPRPYRLLATDHCSGTVLLLDLKPYRIRRIWVEILPTLLLAVDWGYVLAEAGGRVVFLDQNGQQIGRLDCPPQITALALWQNRLWIATWNRNQGSLYSLDLNNIGLDLVF